MSIESLWSLLLIAVSAAFALALKVAELRRTIKDTDKELDLLRAELDALKKHEHEAENKASGLNPQAEKKKTNRKLDLTGVYMR